MNAPPDLTESRRLLAEVDGLLAAMPPRETLRHQTVENGAWFGRAASIMRKWDSGRALFFDMEVGFFIGHGDAHELSTHFVKFMKEIYDARSSLIRIVEPLGLAAGALKLLLLALSKFCVRT